jgi:hypothetical protein
VVLGVLAGARPELGDAEVDQRHRAQVRRHGAGIERPGAGQRAAGLQRVAEVTAQARDVEPQRGERNVEARAPLVGHGGAAGGSAAQVPLGRHVVAALDHHAGERERELRVVVRPVGRHPVDERAQSGGLAADRQVGPALARQPRGEIPRLALDRVQEPARVVSVLGQPRRRPVVQLV